MDSKGSMTVFFCLLLTIVTGLILAFIGSAKAAAARVHIANSLDQSLYSLFALYDRELLDKYSLFLIDGGFGKASLDAGKLYTQVEDDALEVLLPAKGMLPGTNLLGLHLDSGAITGYHLATDMGGAVFKEQVVRYMRDTLAVQGIQLLLDQTQEEKRTVQMLEDRQQDEKNQEVMDDYENKKQAAEAVDTKDAGDADIGAAGAGQAGAPDADGGNEPYAVKDGDPDTGQAGTPSDKDQVEPEVSVEDTGLSFDIAEMIETVEGVMHRGILQLTVPYQEGVSQNRVSAGELLSHRQLQTGMGLIEVDEKTDSAESQLLFAQYVLTHLSNYRRQVHAVGMAYQTEYVLIGKDSDEANLAGVTGRLLLIREAANTLALYQDHVRRAEAKAAAAAAASLLGFPAMTDALEGALILCWAFGESVLDVRELMDGGKVPLFKNQDTWQLSLRDLPKLVGGNPDALRKKSDTGLSYEGYLRALLLLQDGETTVLRCMDMVETVIRQSEGREAFSLDSSIAWLEAELTVRAGKDRIYEAKRSYGY